MRPGTRKLLLLAGLPLVTAACKRPPEAPSDLSDLYSYLFEHLGDEEPDALEVGVENMASWLDANGLDAIQEGYEISLIDAETAYNLPDIDLSEVPRDEFADSLLGGTVLNQHQHTLDDMAYAIVEADQMEVFPDDYQVFERTFLSDLDCFMGAGCDQVEALNYSEAKYAGILSVSSENHAQWRWIDGENRRSLVHRAWLTGPADISFDGVQIPTEFFVTATFPMDDGTVVRLQAVWVVVKIINLDMPEATVLNMFVNSLSNSGEQIEAYLDGE